MHAPRLPLITALLLLFIFAYITGIRLAFSLLYALVLLFALAYLWSRILAGNLALERVGPEGQFQVGDEFEEQFRVQNRGWVPVPVLEVVDFSSLPGYAPARVFPLKGRAVRRWTARGCFRQRGLFTFGPVELRYADPFGLFPRTLRVPGSRSVVVYPVIRPVEPLRALAPSSAGAEEIHGRPLDIPPNSTTIREYVPTDSVKRIHWASSARLGRLVSRSFETREGGDAWLILDLDNRVHVGDAPESTLEYAVSLAASIADAALRQGGAVGLVSNDANLTLIESGRGDQQRNKLLEYFTLAEADGTVSLATLLNAQRDRWVRRGGLIVITPSPHAEWVEALINSAARGRRNLVVYLDPRGFGGSEPGLAIAGRWRQALNWWVIRSQADLEPAPEVERAAG